MEGSHTTKNTAYGPFFSQSIKMLLSLMLHFAGRSDGSIVRALNFNKLLLGMIALSKYGESKS
jgi:hypothetical protein